MTADEIIDKALNIAIGVELDRVIRNPYGPWADDSREFVAAARALQRERNSK